MDPMTETTKAWQCIGCGRIESQATCMGVCHDVPVEMVSAADYRALEAEVDRLRLFVQQLAHVSPRDGAWKRVYEDLQAAAVRLLNHDGPRPAPANGAKRAVDSCCS